MTGKTENGKPEGLGDQVRLRLDQLCVAIGFMTRLPVPYRTSPVARTVWAFPFAGALVGFLSGAVLWGMVTIGLSPVVAAFAALAASALVTGALHEDGLADCADGFWGGHTPERRLEIMRDSRSGVYGVLALILATGMKAMLIVDLVVDLGPAAVWPMLIAVHAMARSALPLAMMQFPMATKTGLAAQVGAPNGSTVVAGLILATFLACFVLIFIPLWILPVLIAILCRVAMLMGGLARSKLGGVTGDSLGATEQIGEITCLIILAILLGT